MFTLQGGSRDETMCHRMYCYIPSRMKCDYTADLRAQEGTSCGNHKWCSKGHCVPDPRAPQTKGTLHSVLRHRVRVSQCRPSRVYHEIQPINPAPLSPQVLHPGSYKVYICQEGLSPKFSLKMSHFVCNLGPVFPFK